MIDQLFGYPFRQLPKLEYFNKKQIIQEIYNAKWQDTGLAGRKEQSSNRGGFQSRKIEELFPITLRYIKKRLTSPDGLDFPHQINGAWANINKKGDYNAPHHHGPYGYSGILFITDAPGLEFIDMSMATLHLSNVSPNINGKSGCMVVFPSPMFHWVEPSQSTEDRITFAFNIDIGEHNFLKTVKVPLVN